MKVTDRDIALVRAALEAARGAIEDTGIGISDPLVWAKADDALRAIDPAAIVAGVPPRHKAERVMDELNHHALDENQRLRDRVAELSKGGLDLASALVDCKAERDALRASVEELESDAARYRWLRNAASWPWVRDNLWMPISGAEFDAAIDAAKRGKE